MCLVALALDQSRRFPLVIASNRDEFFARPSARLAWWEARPGEPPILGGRDLSSGGTWLGLTAQGRLALVTNVRTGEPGDAAAPSRGRMVTDWLADREPIGSFWMRTALSGYNAFNLIAADFRLGECFWGSGSSAPKPLKRGIHGLSNGGLDEPWPKVVSLKAQLAAAIDAAPSAEALAATLFAALGDRGAAPDAQLPGTGIPLELERQLSPAFILTPDHLYGTRCSTLVIAEKKGRRLVTHVYERSFNAGGSLALLRHSMLKNWPPRYVGAAADTPSEPGEVSESDESDLDDDALRTPVQRRTRVRSLLKPAPGRRAPRPAGGGPA